MEKTTVPDPNSKVTMPRDIISAGYLLSSAGKYLLACPTSRTGTTGGWGIPKGKRDPGEDIQNTALREFYEETNLRLLSDDYRHGGNIIIEHLPFHSYSVDGKDKVGKFNKTVFVFRAYDVGGNYVKKEDFKCLTFLENNEPEIDKYKWATAEEALAAVVKSQKGIFESVINYNKLNK